MANLAVFISFSITNIATTIFPKLSGNVMVFEGGKMRPFFHPIMQTLIMSIGESLCLIPFYILSKNKQPNQSSKLPVGISIYFIPTLLDITSSLMVFISLNFISASLYSLLTVTNVIFIAFLSKIMLKSVFSNGQIIGSIIIAISAILAGLGEMLSEKGSEYHIQIILGIALVIISEGAHSYLTIYYEEIFKKYDVTPLQMVGYQGLLGTVCTTIIVIILSFIGCPFPEDKCVFDSDFSLHVESAGSYINQLGNNHYLLILNLLFILFIGRFNYDQCTVIANVNAFSLCVLSIFSNSLVWIVGITITVVGSNNRELALQSLDTEVILVKLAALIVSTLGLLIYNQIIPLCLDKKPTKDDKDYSIIDESD